MVSQGVNAGRVREIDRLVRAPARTDDKPDAIAKTDGKPDAIVKTDAGGWVPSARVVVPGASHGVHHDAPERVAGLLIGHFTEAAIR